MRGNRKTTGIDFLLKQGGVLAVAVVNNVGHAVAEASILLLDPDTGALLIPIQRTDGTGFAGVVNVPVRTKLVVLSPGGKTGRFWKNGATLATADTLIASPGVTTPVIVTLP